MERAIIHSDLTKSQINPNSLLDEYNHLLQKDINKLIPSKTLVRSFCPVTGEKEIQDSFLKMGMHYQVSQTLENIYLSPRPTMEMLRRFNKESLARKFWFTELWTQTQGVRQEKIILPQLEWARGFITQFFSERKLLLAEYFPNHWGYYKSAMNLFEESLFTLVDPLFDTDIANINKRNWLMPDEVTNNSLDAVFLFEALDRTFDPFKCLKIVSNSLKPGGLCFITCLLSSGFEVKLLGQKSEIFVPPERMNLLSYEGMISLIKLIDDFEILEFSTPGVLDIPNVEKQIDNVSNSHFFDYIFKKRQDSELLNSFQEFLQINRLGTFGRLVLRKY